MAEVHADTVIYRGSRYWLNRLAKSWEERRQAMPYVVLLLCLAALSMTAAITNPLGLASVLAAL